jgi:hypothetical protein
MEPGVEDRLAGEEIDGIGSDRLPLAAAVRPNDGRPAIDNGADVWPGMDVDRLRRQGAVIDPDRLRDVDDTHHAIVLVIEEVAVVDKPAGEVEELGADLDVPQGGHRYRV